MSHPACRPISVAFTAACFAATVGAQTELPRVEVIAPGPLPGLGIPKDTVAANVQTAAGADIDRRHALDLTSFLGRTAGSVQLSEIQGNPFQPDLNYRGFTASPLLGTPQGLSVFLDGVRLNQPFGDVVSWDLIPRAAIASTALMPGSNPLFGLNTLGGALSIRTKDGLHDPGSSVQVTAGARRRAAVEFESGGHRADGLDWFVTGNRFHEQGWREASPSGLGQLFGKLGGTLAGTALSLTAAVADTDLTGNGLQEAGALQRDPRSVYTVPDQTRNRSLFLNLAATRPLTDAMTLSGNVYYRRIATQTLNGDANDDSLGESVYQPNAAERAALAAAGYSGFPTSGASAVNTPFPKWRCIADALLDTEPNEKCDGLLNRSATQQHNFGLAVQLAAETRWGGVDHALLVGAAYDASRVHFAQSTQFGYLNPDRSVTPVSGPGAFADGSQASENAFDARVDVASRSQTASAFASDTVALGAKTHLTLSGRYNRNRVTSADAITPGGGPGSLDGQQTFARFNPAIGLTFAATPALTVYGGWNQGARAPTATELGCADPQNPCRLPNALAGDPPLRQVVTTTFEAGLRGAGGPDWSWNLGVFRSDNRDDLLFVSDQASGYGYFRNFGKTRRQGIEAGAAFRPLAALRLGANLSVLDATYRSAEVVDGSSNSSNASAQAGFPGTDGTITIAPGDRIPLLPRQVLKITADWDVSPAWRLGADFAATGGANARGNENGQHRPDGVFYTGPGRSAGYAVLNANVDWRPTPRWKVFLQIDNVFDRRYASAAQLGANAFDASGRVVARAFPANANGDYPVTRSTFLAPGAPRGAWVGVRYTFAD